MVLAGFLAFLCRNCRSVRGLSRDTYNQCYVREMIEVIT